jgi:hypothetical protein
VNLPPPFPQYDPENEAQMRAALVREDARNRKKGADVEIGKARLILTAPNGTRYAVTVSNTGVISAVAV